MRTIRQFAVLAFAGGVLALSAALAQAQNFPGKMVRITSPFPAGLTPDVITRVVADKLGRAWGQQVVVEARPGANGLIAIGAFKKAAPDGHELLLLPNAQLTINPHLIKSIPYDPESDFVPVSLLYRTGFLVAVSATGPYRSMRDLIAAARANPERITYSTPFVGSGPHVGGALLAYLTGTKMVPVQFKEGSQMFTSIINGDVAFIVSTSGSAASLVKAGRIRYLAVAGPARLESDPDVPAIGEVGGPADFSVDTWGGIVAPRGTPPELARRIGADIAKALAEPDVRARYRAVGFEAKSSTPAEMGDLIRTELRRYGDMVKRIGITSE